MKKYTVIETFTTGLLLEVEAENKDAAQEIFLNTIGKMSSENYASLVATGAGDSYFEIEEIG